MHAVSKTEPVVFRYLPWGHGSQIAKTHYLAGICLQGNLNTLFEDHFWNICLAYTQYMKKFCVLDNVNLADTPDIAWMP